MKKVLSYIIISFIILANILAPFTFSFKEKVLLKNEVKAWTPFGILDGKNSSGIVLKIDPEVTDNQIRINFNVNWAANSAFTTTDFKVFLYDENGTKIDEKKPKIDSSDWTEEKQSGYVIFSNGIKPNTKYKFDVLLFNESMDALQTLSNIATLGIKQESNTGYLKNDVPYEITTLPEDNSNDTVFVKQEIENSLLKNDAAVMPECSIMTSSTWGGCIGLVLYKLFFQPSSWLFALTGKIFDFTFNYSIMDSSYRSSFVSEGWGIIRDLCNIFFIFILLYIGIGTILGFHGVNYKNMIRDVVLIGLFINFSLFATQVIIDISNITARVFYNQISVGETNKANGQIEEETGSFGEKQVSVAIVKKINPQKIILSAEEASNVRAKGLNISETGNTDGSSISSGTFIMVTLLASIMNIVGMFVFLSISLIFIARVIGLWLAMIFAPLAFLSYAVPQMQTMDMIGWKKWWPETINMAFLAPVFIFFMYIIIMFLDSGLGIINADNKHGLDFFIAIMIPFAFLMILMLKAKDIAKNMSGSMGQSITNAVATVGGLALGGAALGGAALLRGTVGRTAAKASRGETATQKFEAAKGNPQAMAALSNWDKIKGGLGSYATFGLLGKAYGKIDPITGKVTTGKGIGGLLNKKKEDVGHIEHSRHDLQDIKKTAHLDHIDDSKLTGTDIEKIKTVYNKTKRAETETKVKTEGIEYTDNYGVTQRVRSENEYQAKERQRIIDEIQRDPDSMTRGDTDYHGNLTDSGRKKVEDQLKVEFHALLKTETDKKLIEDFNHLQENSRKHISMLDRGISGLNKHSFDLRDLSKLKSDKKDGLLNKIPTALIAGVAMGVRTGLKSGMGIDHGKGQGNFTKDLTTTITEALKGIKIEMPKSSGGGGGHDDHGGGHGGGHH